MAAKKIDKAEIEAALGRVNRALGQDSSGGVDHYIIGGGRIAAYNGRVVASAPFPWGGDAIVAGADVERIIARLPGDATITVKSDQLSIKSGRFGGRIRLLDAAATWAIPDVTGDLPLTGDAAASIARATRKLKPVISDVMIPPWMGSMIITPGAATAVSDGAHVVARVEIDPSIDASALIPRAAVEFIAARDDDPTGAEIAENHAAFAWADGTFMRTQLLTGNPPSAIEKILDDVTKNEMTEITPEWRAAYDRVAFAPDVRISPTTLLAVGDRSEADDAAETGLADGVDETLWSATVLDLALSLATKWSLAGWPGACPFAGDGVRGAFAGKAIKGGG